MIKSKTILPELTLGKDRVYEVDSVVGDCYRIKIPMVQKGKFKYALVGDDEGILV